jgi:hypothetical protein
MALELPFSKKGAVPDPVESEPRALVAGEVFDGSKIQRDVLSARPFFNRAAGHQVHVGPRFTRKQTMSSEPVANAPGSGVVGSCGKTEIAKLPVQITQ